MNWFLIFTAVFSLNNEIVIFDKNLKAQKWYITNDNVMGGISNSTMEIDTNGSALFSGEVSTDNNGGFAMTRLPLDLEIDNKKSKIILTIIGDDKQYQLRIKSKKYQRYWYVQKFYAKRGAQEIVLSLKDFYPSFRGYQLNKENFDGASIKELAILIGNKKNESFSLKINKIIIE
jgi:hypothetical protein